MKYIYLACRPIWQKLRRGHYLRIVSQVNRLEESLTSLGREDLDQQLMDLYSRARARKDIKSLIPMALAIGREYSKRVLGMRNYDVQLMGTLAEKAMLLSEKRHQAADQLSQAIVGELQDLRMEQAQFAVDFRVEPDEEQGLSLPSGEKVRFDQHGFEEEDPALEERISGKGELSRKRTVLGDELDTGDEPGLEIHLEVDEAVCRRGRVLEPTLDGLQFLGEVSGQLEARNRACRDPLQVVCVAPARQ